MIREAKICDAEVIARIILKAWESAYVGIVDPSYYRKMREEDYVSLMLNNLTQKTETIFVYDEGGSVKGFISGKLGDGGCGCEVVGFYVLPGCQRQGIGKALLNKVGEYFKGRGCRRMVAWTLLGAENNGFYESQGGMPLERKEISIDGKDYPGVGFVFQL